MNISMTIRMTITAVLLAGLASGAGCGRSTRDFKANAAGVASLEKQFKEAGLGGGGSTVTAPKADPIGWGTLRGFVKLAGAAPAPQPLTINKDTQVCGASGRIVSEELVVGPDGGIKNVLIFVSEKLKADEPWTHSLAKLGKTDVVDFDQKNCVFTKHLLAVQSSQPIKLTNSDSVGHNANLAANNNPRFDQTIAGGGEVIYQPKAEEVQPFPVSCAIHPWMKAWIITRNNSYFAVTGADGSFAIENLPAGVDLEFRVWQERLGFVKTAIVANQPVSWPGGKLKQKIAVGDGTTLDIKLDASLFK